MCAAQLLEKRRLSGDVVMSDVNLFHFTAPHLSLAQPHTGTTRLSSSTSNVYSQITNSYNSCLIASRVTVNMSSFCSSSQHTDHTMLYGIDEYVLTYSCPLVVLVLLFVCGYIADCFKAWQGSDNILQKQSAQKQKNREADVNMALRTMIIPHDYVSENVEDDCCPICQCEYEPNDEVAYVDPCKHMFHRKCISDWLVCHSKSDCPCCRVSVIEEAPENDYLEGHDESWVDYLVTAFFYQYAGGGLSMIMYQFEESE